MGKGVTRSTGRKPGFRVEICVMIGILLICAAVASMPARAAIDTAIQKIINELQATMHPPEVLDLKLSPEAPEADESVTVNAVIRNKRELTDDETMTAWLYYSTDGAETWSEIEMETEDFANWTAEIPGQPVGTTVNYYFRAEDTSLNIYVERPCMVTAIWPTVDDPCLAAAAIDEEPVDDNEFVLEDDMDIIDARIGEDDKFFYIQMKVQGKVSDGTMSPAYARVYGGALENPDRRGADILNRGIAFLFAPLAQTVNFNECLAIYEKGGDAVFGPTGISCYRQGPYMLFRFEKSFVGANPSQWIRAAVATAIVNDFNLDTVPVVPKDYTHITRFKRISRSYTIR